MFSIRRVRRATSALLLAAGLATATLQAPAAQAAASPVQAQGLPIVAASEGAANTQKADLVVLFQRTEFHVYGTDMIYTVANAGPGTAHNVVVTKTLKVESNGGPNAIAAPPATEKLNSLSPGQWREIRITCNTTLAGRCKGSSVSAKTSTPEIIPNNNTASHTF